MALPIKAMVGIGGKPVQVSFHEGGHTYETETGVIIPSVTQLMKVLTDKAYAMINRDTLRAAAEFGTAVHACTEYYDLDDLDEDSVLDEWKPCMDAYKSFVADHQPKYIAIEQRLACEQWAGTIDRIGTIGDDLWIIDLKTTSAIHEFAGVQLAGYTLLWFINHPEENRPIRRAVLQLRKDGSYRFKEFTDPMDFSCFSALLTLHKWEINHG